MELVDVYDSQRRRTGITAERGNIPSGGYRVIVHMCVFDDDWRMLIQKRANGKISFPGYWDVSAGGQVDAGEEPCEGASRELFEEMGIRRRFTPEDRVCTVSYGNIFEDYFITGWTSRDSLYLQGSEVSEAMWATMDEISELIEDRRFIQYRQSFIQSLFDCHYRFIPVEDCGSDKAYYPYDRYV